MRTVSEQRCHGGVQGFYSHESESTGTPMGFAVCRPLEAEQGPVPVLYYLAGLTCTEETATIEADAQESARKLLELLPKFSIERYIHFFRYKDRARNEHTAQALREAGLPE